MKKILFLTIAATLGLSATTMAQNVPSYVPTNGLVGWWPFTGNVNDLSVNTNNGTVTGATLTADRFGNPNNAYSFNGTSANYIDVPHNASFDVSNVTISAWYNAIDYGVNTTSWKRLIVSKREWGGWGNSFEVNIEAPYSGTSNKMQACWTINGVNSFLTFEDGSLLTNTWSHFVYTHDNDSAKIYLNGDLVQSMAISGGLTYNTLPVRFGGRPVDGWHPFNGALDDIGIWNRALTACEIQDLYSSQLNSNDEINAGNDITVCQGDEVTLSGSGGSNYNWSGGINNSTPFEPSTSQDYVLTALSSNGCLGTDTVSVIVNSGVGISAGIDTTVCQGNQVTLSGSGGSNYNWSGGINNNTPFVPSNSQDYVLTALSSNGCLGTDTVSVTVNSGVGISAGIDTTVCQGDQVTLSGSGGSNYNWNGGINNNTAFVPANSQDYVLTALSSNGCLGTDTVSVTVNPRPLVSAGNDQSICEGDNVTLTASGAETYSWSNGILDGVAFGPPFGTTTYTLTGIGENGCIDTDEVVVTSNYCFEIPGALSPNSDNNNDTWEITGLQNHPNAIISVFDRWGQKVYEGTSTSVPWNGKYQEKDLPTADYYYVIELGNGNNYNGVVTLKR
jgi:gliding motility-associated-like protein